MELADITNFLGITNTKLKEAKPPIKPEFDIKEEDERKSLYSCTVPARVTKKLATPKITKTMIVIAIVGALLLAIMGEYFLILVIASLVFIKYVLSATPAEKITYSITNHGVNYAGQGYLWSDLKHYFFTEEEGVDILNVDVKDGLPARLFLTVKEGDKTKLHEIFQQYLPYLDKPPQSFIDKAYSSVADKFDFGNK